MLPTAAAATAGAGAGAGSEQEEEQQEEGEDQRQREQQEEARERYVLADSAHALFACRLRARGDREGAARAFADVFGWAPRPDLNPRVLTLALPPHRVTAGDGSVKGDRGEGEGEGVAVAAQVEAHASYDAPHVLLVGSALLPVHAAPRAAPGGFNGEEGAGFDAAAPRANPLLLGGELPKVLEVLAHCAALRWPALLVGPSGSGKRRVLRHLARLSGHALVEVRPCICLDLTPI